MSNKFGYCIVSISPIRAEKRDASEMVSQLVFGEIVTVHEITEPWCKIQTYTDNYEGYVDIKHIHLLSEKEVSRWLNGLVNQQELLREIQTPWGNQLIYRGSFLPFDQEATFKIGNDSFSFIEPINKSPRFNNPVEASLAYLNTPYLWGGKSPFGIDCSGLTQTVFRMFDLNIPRDASEQFEYGADVEFDDIQANDLAFFKNKEGKIIHVGILDGEGNIIHASGFVRKDKITKEGILNSETAQITHYLESIKRL